jgi:type I restriction enzyme R subunit
MAYFDEAKLEQVIIELFTQEGYQYTKGSDIDRKTSDIILKDDFLTYFNKKYASLTNKEIDSIYNRLNDVSVSPLYEAVKKEYELISDKSFYIDREDTSLPQLFIELIDFDHIDNNVFRVVNQYEVDVRGQDFVRIPDMLIFINGIPIGICEFKSAIKEDTTLHDAWEQIYIRYRRDIPNLLKYCFMSMISDGVNTKLGTIFSEYEFYNSWNKVNDNDKEVNGIKSLFTMIKGAFSKERILKLLNDYICFPDKSDKELMIIARYPQFFATEKLLANIKEHMKPYGDGKGGTYFGATGCGKTYTMLFLSRKIAKDNASFKNPTIVVLEDREDLDDQTASLFESSTNFLRAGEVASISSRLDLKEKMGKRESGGVFISTVQKFSDGLDLLNQRTNIICISDEAHRTQTNIAPKLVGLRRLKGKDSTIADELSKEGLSTKYGFAYYLRESFPNATYVGFTGTPIDATLKVFGDIVDSYKMIDAVNDGITVDIKYEEALARIKSNQDELKKIEEFYQQCAIDGSNEYQIEKSKKAMSSLSELLSNPTRLKEIAEDFVKHYERRVAEGATVLGKAMFVCQDRKIAYQMYKNILALRPDWGIVRKTENDSKYSKRELDSLTPVAKLNIVATRDKNDEPSLYNLLGTSEDRKHLSDLFKDNKSNFKIVILVDMWITGFDCMSLDTMYIDKAIKTHNLIQTISRVNRVFKGKNEGLIVDYIGIKKALQEAMKLYGGDIESPIQEINISVQIFREFLAKLNEMFDSFDSTDYFSGNGIAQLWCLDEACDFVCETKEKETTFVGYTKRLKNAYEITIASGELTTDEIDKALFYMAVRALVYKTTINGSLDAERMNDKVRAMLSQALACSGVESIYNNENIKREDIFSDDFLKSLEDVKLPITKFKALIKLLQQAIKAYAKMNRLKGIVFDEKMQQIVDEYNARTGTAHQVLEIVDGLIEKAIELLQDIKIDKSSFEKLGITYQEKAFYDILVAIRDKYKFDYSDEKCIELSKKIENIVADVSSYANWEKRNDMKKKLQSDLIRELYNNGYPPKYNSEVFKEVLEQAEHFRENI